MARSAFIFVFVAVAASAVLAGDYQYPLKEVDKINDFIVGCIKDVANNTDGTNPGDDCRFEAMLALADGYSKTIIPGLVKDCMGGKGASDYDVSSVHECLKPNL